MVCVFASPFRGYIFALAAVTIAVGGRYLLHPMLGKEALFAPVLLAVLITAWVYGLRPALVAVIFGALAADYVLLEPSGSFFIPELNQQIGLLLYLLIGLGTACIAGSMHDAQAALREANRTLERSVEERTTELTLRNQQLERSESRLSFALKYGRIGGWALNLSDFSAYRTAEHDRIFGYDPPLAEWNYDLFIDHVLPEDRAEVDRRFQAALSEGTPWDFECRIRRADGASRWIWATGEQEFDDRSRPLRMTGIVQDITDRKHSEIALQERERLLAIVTDTARVGLVVVGPGYQYLFANRSYADIFELQSENLVGRHVPEILPAAWSQIQPRLDRALAGERVAYELALPGADGSPVRHYAVNYEPRVSENGEPSVVVVVLEITERKHAELALAERERMLQFVTSSVCVGLVVIDSNYRYLFANEAYGQIYGLQVSEIVGRTVSEVIPFAWPQIKPHLDKSLAGTPGGFDLVLPPLPGRDRPRTLAVAYEPRKREDGSPTSVVVISDITERKEAAQEAVRLSERVTLATRAAGMGIWDWDLLDGQISWDDQMFGLYGRTRGDFERAYEAWLSSIHPDDRERCDQESKLALEGLSDYESEFRVIWTDGSLHYLKAIGEVYRNEAGRPVRMLGVNFDITEARLGEVAIKQQQMRLEGIVNSAMDGIITVGEDQQVILMNAAAERMFGCRAEDILGTRVERFIPERSRAAHEGHVRAFGATGVAARAMGKFGPISGLRANGEEFPIEASISQIEVDGHKLFTVTCRDVTEWVQAEADRKALEAQLQQSQKMEAFGQLAGGVAHDFNNLLTIINGYSEWLLGSLSKDSNLRNHLEEIQKAGLRAAALTRQLLAFSRQQVIEPKVLKLNAVVEGVETMLRRLIGEDVQLSTVLCPSAGLVKVDPGQIEQVILNLAVNSRDAMPQGGRLTIETDLVELDAEYARSHAEVHPGRFNLLAISDTGDGMSREVRERVFEPFFTTKGPGRGTGLGLAVVHGIVKQNGGHVAVYSEPGKGTTFKIYLAVVSDESADHTVHDDLPLQGSGETILLVEDEVSLREVTALALTGFGYTVLTASDGREAIERMAEEGGQVDLLLTDVIMPEMSGRSLAETLGARYPELKVLFTSGYTDDAVMRHGVLQSEVAFLQKPYTLEGLARKVRDSLRR